MVLSYHSQDTPLYAAMEKHCRRLGIQWQMLQADRQTEVPGLFSVEERFLPMLQVYGAQAVNAVSFALAAGMDPASAVHELNKSMLEILEQFEQSPTAFDRQSH